MKNNCCNLKQSKISMNIFHHTVGPSNFSSSGTANTSHLIKDKQRERIRERERERESASTFGSLFLLSFYSYLIEHNCKMDRLGLKNTPECCSRYFIPTVITRRQILFRLDFS